MVKFRDKWLLLFYKLFHAFAQYLIYISLNLTVPSSEIAAKSISLIDDFHGNPADKIVVARAKSLEATLLTRDQKTLT